MEVVNTTSTTDPVNMYNNLNNFILNPMVFIIVLLIIVAYYAFSSSLGTGNLGSNEGSNGGSIFGIIIIYKVPRPSLFAKAGSKQAGLFCLSQLV